MERFGASFLIAGVVTFLLGFFLQGWMPVITLRKLPIATVEEIAQNVPASFHELASDYPEEFQKTFGEPNPETFARALRQGKAIYIAEANSAQVVAYLIPWNSSLNAAGKPQRGEFVPVGKLQLRTAVVRDQ